MDPVVTSGMISAALTKLLDSAATSAGTKAWDALTALITRHRGKAPDKPTSPEEVAALADDLSAAAQDDPALAGDLLTWHQSIGGSDNTVNVVSGSASRFVQGRDFNDSTINLS